jgi:hypothetical protein
MLPRVATTGCGRIVIVNDFALAPALTQLFLVADTVIVATMSVPVKLFGLVYELILPVPLADNPIEGLEFVQLNVSPPAVLAEKITAGTASPEQMETLAITLTTGCGLIVIVNDFEFGPTLTHPFLVAVTVIVPTISTPLKLEGATKAGMLPLPDAARPIDVLVLDQLKVSAPPVFAEKLIAEIASPEQTEMLGTTAKTGWGLTVIENDFELAPVLKQPFFVAETVIVATISTPVKLVGAV